MSADAAPFRRLMEADGHYAELYNTYFRHQTLDYVEQARQVALGD